MKATISKAILAICILLTLAGFIIFTGKSARTQAAATSYQETVPVLPGGAYSELVNGFTAEGR